MNREHERNPKRWAAVAPMPPDPSTCRWCGGRLKALMPDMPVDYCANGCAHNASAPYTGHCEACHRDFETGARFTVLCFACDTAEATQAAREYEPGMTRRDDWLERRTARRRRT
jgi:hypothetical protein